jgi:hypothetical protein
VSSLEVSIATGVSGPVLVLAGEADFTSITRLDKALTAQIAGQAVLDPAPGSGGDSPGRWLTAGQGGGPPGRSDNSRSIFCRTGLASRHRWPHATAGLPLLKPSN